MKTIEQYDDWVERYRSGDLQGADRLEFESELKSDPTLQKVVKLHEEIDEASKDEEVNALRKTLKQAHARFLEREKQKARSLKIFLKVAAVVVLLVGLGAVIFLLNKKDMTNDEMFDHYYAYYEIPLDYRSGEDQSELDLSNGITSYYNKNFNSSLSQFNKVIQSDSSMNSAYFFAGMSLIELGRYDEAKYYLHYVINQNDKLFGQQSEWYLALVSTKTNDLQQAISLLEQIESTDHYKKEKAGKLLKELKRLK